jgi:hypothetical protein
LQATTFGGSGLVRLLAPWMPSPPAAPADTDFAERLALRLGPLDAIALRAAHQQAQALRPTAQHAGPALVRALREDVERARQALEAAIAQPIEPFFEVPLPPQRGERGQPPSLVQALGAGYQRRHGALQKQMEPMVAGLREHVRARLGRASAALQRLAVLDAALETVLAPREQAALARIGRVLEQRWRHHRDHAVDDAAPAGTAPPWIAAFDTEWRDALRAERELRLQPVLGLVEAADEDSRTHA